MCDSDDTDFLLLIPPDFFISSVEEDVERGDCDDRTTPNRSVNGQRTLAIVDNYDSRLLNATATATAATTLALAMSSRPYDYAFLSPRKRAEVECIDQQLMPFELDRASIVSDLSAISSCAAPMHSKAEAETEPGRTSLGLLIHSTPKCAILPPANEHHRNSDDEVLHQIDDFLEDYAPTKSHSDDYYGEGKQRNQHDRSATTLANAAAALANDHAGNLISLSDIWGRNGRPCTPLSACCLTLKEEKLRRQHLEKIIHSLQGKLLEYQQRLSIAIEVDRTKDSALARLQSENTNLHQELRQQREAVQKLEAEQLERHQKDKLLQNELAQAVNIAAKFQDENKKLKEELTISSSMLRKQVDELELKLLGSKTTEEHALKDLTKVKDRLVKVEHQHDKLKIRCDDAEKELQTLHSQKDVLQDLQQKQKNRADLLETQKKTLQDSLAVQTENELQLKKKLDIQQKSLKAHYQEQLEKVVAQKLKEFQEQLDKVEVTLKTEARDRERLIADRAVKQLELITGKSELELNLMQEKHNKEVELYRIQMANASRKIESLEMKLNAYKARRADIAEKLHDVMEAQWQKALEILTSPNNSRRLGTSTDGESIHGHAKPSTDNGQSAMEKTTAPSMGLSPLHEKLHAYIELLLSKSPSDLDKLDQIIALVPKVRTQQDKNARRLNNGKPPWKA